MRPIKSVTKSVVLPPSANEGQISKTDTKKLSVFLMEDSKKIKWNSIRAILRTYHPNKKGAPDLDGLLRQALERACHAPSGRSTVELILQKLKNLSMPERTSFAGKAVQCKNMEALEAIVHDDPSVLFFNLSYDDFDADDLPLFHSVCFKYGWNKEIQFLLKVILETRDENGENIMYIHEGLFQETDELDTLLMLSMDAGADLDEIIDHLRDEYPVYLKANLIHVAEVISKHSLDMHLLRDLIRWSDNTLLFSTHPRDGSSLLCFACCKHNQEMIRALCDEYFTHYRFGEGSFDTYSSLVCVQNHLLESNNEGVSPLGDLLLSVGNADADFAWDCIHECVNFFTLWESHYLEDERKVSRSVRRFHFPILHLFLSQKWDEVLLKRKCILMLFQFVDRLGINVCSIDDEDGDTLLSIVIEKMATGTPASDRKVSLEVLDFFLNPDNASASTNPPAMTRNGSGRLPLHSACEHSLSWKAGLERIVTANMPALELVDPITGLLPFAHCSVGAKSDLDSIYELLRLHPGSIEGSVSRSIVECN